MVTRMSEGLTAVGSRLRGLLGRPVEVTEAEPDRGQSERGPYRSSGPEPYGQGQTRGHRWPDGPGGLGQAGGIEDRAKGDPA